ncbi:MAG TPA: hypothetical protein VHT91_34430, partial [Kofleriaceae bacterium]|nr:hypothetical protein [Kofleriaceae bacterium]
VGAQLAAAAPAAVIAVIAVIAVRAPVRRAAAIALGEPLVAAAPAAVVAVGRVIRALIEALIPALVEALIEAHAAALVALAAVLGSPAPLGLVAIIELAVVVAHRAVAIAIPFVVAVIAGPVRVSTRVHASVLVRHLRRGCISRASSRDGGAPRAPAVRAGAAPLQAQRRCAAAHRCGSVRAAAGGDRDQVRRTIFIALSRLCTNMS